MSCLQMCRSQHTHVYHNKGDRGEGTQTVFRRVRIHNVVGVQISSVVGVRDPPKWGGGAGWVCCCL